MKVKSMQAVIGGKRYSTDKATLIASDLYWDGNGWERRGRNTFLFRTAKGAFFVQRQTQWQGERDSIEPLSEEAAAELYEQLPEHEVDFEEAFPGKVAEDA